MKFFLLPLFLFYTLYSIAQNNQGAARRFVPETIIAFVKGHPYEEKIDAFSFKQTARKGMLELVLSDSNYKVVSYTFTCDDSDNIYSCPNTGSLMLSPFGIRSLNYIPNNSLITFEDIRVCKDSQYYYVLPLVLSLTDSTTAKQYRETHALCLAYLRSYRNSNSLRSGTITTDLVLSLTNPSYELLSFELNLTDEDGNELSTIINGNTIHLEKDFVTRTLNRLKAGSFFSIENIKVSKNNRPYTLKPLRIGLF